MSKKLTLKERIIKTLDKDGRKKFTCKELASRLNKGTDKTVNTGAIGTAFKWLPKKYKGRVIFETKETS